VDDDDWVWGEDEEETTYAQGRVPQRTYISKTFTIDRPSSRDHGQPARFVHKVFDPAGETVARFDGTEWTLGETPKGRYQFKLLIAREAGRIKELWIQRVPPAGSPGRVKVLLNLRGPEAEHLVELLRTLEFIPIDGDTSVRVDDALVRDLFSNPEGMLSLYRRDPGRFRRLIAADESAPDVVATAHRNAELIRFRRLLEDDDYFDEQTQHTAHHRPEDVWQDFFEKNPWMLGVSLSGQLLTSWSSTRLEQVVAGHSIAGAGKRTDALLRTNGRIRSMVFAEFKTHRTPLMASKYRSGCWPPSDDLVAGVAQVHGTVHRAVAEIGDRLPDVATDGSEVPGEFTYLVRPRSYLIIGQLAQLVGMAGGHHEDRIRSFELYRRHLIEPEVVTFDELLAKAEALTSLGNDSP